MSGKSVVICIMNHTHFGTSWKLRILNKFRLSDISRSGVTHVCTRPPWGANYHQTLRFITPLPTYTSTALKVSVFLFSTICSIALCSCVAALSRDYRVIPRLTHALVRYIRHVILLLLRTVSVLFGGQAKNFKDLSMCRELLFIPQVSIWYMCLKCNFWTTLQITHN